MPKVDFTLRITLALIAIFLGMIALRPFVSPTTNVMADAARFDHVFIASAGFLYKGDQGLLVMDRRNGNVWFIPKQTNGGGGAVSFGDPVFLVRVPFEKLDQAP